MSDTSFSLVSKLPATINYHPFRLASNSRTAAFKENELTLQRKRVFMQTSLTREFLVHKNAMRDVVRIKSSRDKNTMVVVFSRSKVFEFVFLKGGGAAKKYAGRKRKG